MVVAAVRGSGDAGGGVRDVVVVVMRLDPRSRRREVRLAAARGALARRLVDDEDEDNGNDVLDVLDEAATESVMC